MQKNNADLCTANLSIDIISLSSFKMHCLTQKEKKNFQNIISKQKLINYVIYV